MEAPKPEPKIKFDEFWNAKKVGGGYVLPFRGETDKKYFVGHTGLNKDRVSHLILKDVDGGSVLFAKVELDDSIKIRPNFQDNDLGFTVSEILLMHYPMKVEDRTIRPFLIRLQNREVGETFDTQLGIKFTVEDESAFQEAFDKIK